MQEHYPARICIYAILCVLFGMSSPAAKAAGFDLATFCGPTPPPEATLLQIYKDQCPAWVISQFEAASTAQAATTAGADSTQTGKDLDNLTKQIEQLQKLYPQATVNQRLATPATSFSAATHYATRKQSELIYKSAEAIGRALSNGLAGKGEGSVLLLVGSTAEEQLLPPVDASLVSGDLKFLQDQLGGKICTAADISITIPREALINHSDRLKFVQRDRASIDGNETDPAQFCDEWL